MTDNEIIKALECCSTVNHCASDCPYDDDDNGCAGCTTKLAKDALDLINRQKAEIERLQKENASLKDIKCIYSYDGETVEYCVQSPCPISYTADCIKTKAIKEFAERLKEKAGEYMHGGEVDVFDIDNLVKEMVGEQE